MQLTTECAAMASPCVTIPFKVSANVELFTPALNRTVTPTCSQARRRSFRQAEGVHVPAPDLVQRVKRRFAAIVADRFSGVGVVLHVRVGANGREGPSHVPRP